MDPAARVVERIESWRGEMGALAHEIHENPELALEEHRSMAWLADFCEGRGLSTERAAHGLAPAFRSEDGADTGPVVIFCAEYDALPGIGHACGHNLIGVASAAAGAAVAEVAGSVGGRSVVLGTPAEEAQGGKIMLLERGAFDGAAASLMVHPSTLDAEWTPSMAIVDVGVAYTGKAAHAAVAPHKGVNALDALVTAYQAVGNLRQHIRPTERIHGIITDGGKAPNVVPDRSAGTFYIRAATAEALQALRARVEGCFRSGADATGAEMALSWGTPYSEVVPNRPLALRYRHHAESLGRRLVDPEAIPRHASGSTDMGNVTLALPAIHPVIAVAPPGVPPHSPEFADFTDTEPARDAMVAAAKAMALTALDVMTDRDLRDGMRRWFDSGERPWKPELER